MAVACLTTERPKTFVMSIDNNTMADTADQTRSLTVLPGVGGAYASTWAEAADATIFWLFVAGLTWVPFWNGSNELLAWGVNAVLFAGLTAAYEISLLIRGASHPVGIRNIAIPAVLFGLVLLWIYFQTITLSYSWLNHPIWSMAADALGKPVQGSISVNRDLTNLALLRLVTAGLAFWTGL